jgi:hypothetical protein
MDGTGSWDTLEWTKLDSTSGSGSFSNLSCLLESERVIVEVELVKVSLLFEFLLPYPAIEFETWYAICICP